MTDLEKEREAFLDDLMNIDEAKQSPTKEVALIPETKPFHNVEPHQAIAQFVHSQDEEINDLKQQIAELHASRASWVEYSQKIESGEFVLVSREQTLQMLKLADKHVMDCHATPESAYKAIITKMII